MNGKMLDELLKNYEKVSNLLEDAEHTREVIKKTKVEYESKILNMAFELLCKVDLYETYSDKDCYPTDVIIEYNDDLNRWEIELN